MCVEYTTYIPSTAAIIPPEIKVPAVELENMNKELLAKNTDYYEDEIDLYELWLVLKKRKVYILTTTLIFLLFGVVYTLISPNVYRSSAIVALPTTNTNTNIIVDFHTTEKIIEALNKKLKESGYSKLPAEIRESFKKAEVKNVDAESLGRRGNRDVFILNVEGLNKDDLSEALLSVLNFLNNNSYVKNMINEQKTLIKKQIGILKRELPKVEKELSSIKKELLTSKKIKIVGFNPLDLDKKLIDLKTELMNLNYTLNSGIHGYEVIYSSLSDNPVKPKRKLILAVSFVSGLFLGIFVAFFVEWLENARRRFSGAPQQ